MNVFLIGFVVLPIVLCIEQLGTYDNEQYPTFYLSGNDSLYVGGKDILYQFALNGSFNMAIPIPTVNQGGCPCKTHCHNYIRLIRKIESQHLVCGTNSGSPRCWHFDNGTLTDYDKWNADLSPPDPDVNFLVLVMGDDIYTTVIRRSNNGNKKIDRFRKIYKEDPLLYTGDGFFKKPEFMKAIVTNDTILLFYNDDNRITRSTEKRVSMVARMCKGDSGPNDPNSYSAYSTALMSRLLCGNPQSQQWYPFVQDVTLVNDTIYGLFTNGWNQSAVCEYSLSDIERAFASGLYESKKTTSSPPGKCLPPGTRTPIDTFTEVYNHPETNDWVKPLQGGTLFKSGKHYTNLIVDDVYTHNASHKVLFLATHTGTIHKRLQIENRTQCLGTIKPLDKPQRILFMELDSWQIYVGTKHEVDGFMVDECDGYNRCKECNLDPYCIWTAQGCRSALRGESHVKGLACSFKQPAARKRTSRNVKSQGCV